MPVKRDTLARIETLEVLSWNAQPRMLSCGWLANQLPADYEGERHYVIVKRTPTASPNIEWCEFEERAGPAPAEG